MSLVIFILFIGIFSQYSNGISNDVKFSLNDIPMKYKSVLCDGQKSSCPNNETCCQLGSGQYGCCPLSGGVCCGDQLHCCPSGYTCDIEHSRCQKQSQETSGVVCPGGEMTCADGETCIQLQSNDYSCCPLPDAVQCKDSDHCCPSGYKCDMEKNKCEKGIFIPWFTSKKATPFQVQSKLILSSSLPTVQCSDKNSGCSEDTTCCELSNSTYGCCPFRHGSCCADKTHCCEEGYSCDVSGSKCIRDVSLIPLTTSEKHVCPDGITKCSASSTCCPNKQNDETTYTCCPYAQGVCCGSSCCPNKYICHQDTLTCHLDETIATATEMKNINHCAIQPSIRSTESLPPHVLCQCPPNQVLCPNGNCCPPNKCSPRSICLS